MPGAPIRGTGAALQRLPVDAARPGVTGRFSLLRRRVPVLTVPFPMGDEW